MRFRFILLPAGLGNYLTLRERLRIRRRDRNEMAHVVREDWGRAVLYWTTLLYKNE